MSILEITVLEIGKVEKQARPWASEDAGAQSDGALLSRVLEHPMEFGRSVGGIFRCLQR